MYEPLLCLSVMPLTKCPMDSFNAKFIGVVSPRSAESQHSNILVRPQCLMAEPHIMRKREFTSPQHVNASGLR
jgi:hypothetical protein